MLQSGSFSRPMGLIQFPFPQLLASINQSITGGTRLSDGSPCRRVATGGSRDAAGGQHRRCDPILPVQYAALADTDQAQTSRKRWKHWATAVHCAPAAAPRMVAATHGVLIQGCVVSGRGALGICSAACLLPSPAAGRAGSSAWGSQTVAHDISAAAAPPAVQRLCRRRRAAAAAHSPLAPAPPRHAATWR